jgi:hypothetical protein
MRIATRLLTCFVLAVAVLSLGGCYAEVAPPPPVGVYYGPARPAPPPPQGYYHYYYRGSVVVR